MPDKKLPISEFAAKLKVKYPQYRNLDDTDLVTRITERYPQYKNAVDLSGLSKKKEVSEPVSTSGGTLGTSEVPSEEKPPKGFEGLKPAKVQPTQVFEEKGVGEDTMLTRKMERAQKQAISGTEVRLPAAPKAVAAERGMQRAVEPMVEKPTRPETQSWLSNTVSALDRGFYKNLIGNPMLGLSTIIKYGTSAMTGGRVKEGPISDALSKMGNWFNNAIDEVAPQDPEFKNSLSDQFAQALGQVGSMVLTGGIGAGGRTAAGVVPKVAPKVPVTEVGKKLAPIVNATKGAAKELVSEIASPAAISAGLSMGQSEFEKAKQAGASDDQAFEAFYKNAAVGSILEKIPVMQFLKRFNKSTQGGVANYIKTKGVAGVTGGMEELTTEVLQQLYANKTAQDIYNVNQNIFEGLAESGGIGFGVGFLLNAMGARAKVLRNEGKEAEAKVVEDQVKEFESRASKGAAAEPQVPPTPSPIVAEEKVVTPTEEVKAEEVVQPVGEVVPQVPVTEEKTYRVEYFNPETRKMTHQMFATEAEGEAFKKTLTREQTSQGVRSYFEKAPAKGVGEVVTKAAPEVPATPEVTDTEYNEFIDKGIVAPERLNEIAQKVKNKEVLSEREQAIFTDKTADVNKIIAGEVEAAPQVPAEPIAEEELPFGETAPRETVETKEEKNLIKRAMNLEVDTPRAEVLQYFLGDGKIHPDALRELFQRRNPYRWKNARPAELNYRKSITAKTIKRGDRQVEAPKIEELAEIIAGTDRLDQVQEFRDAIEEVLLGPVGKRAIAKELTSQYDADFIEMKKAAELEEVGKEIEAETQAFVSQVPATQQEEILKVLDKFRDNDGFIDWRKIDDEIKFGFEPVLLDLSEPSRKIIDNAIKQFEETGRVGRISPEALPTEAKAGDAARSLAERIRAGKINKEGFRASTGFDVVWDAALEIVASSLEAGASVADAVQDGLKYIRTTDWYKNLTDKKDFEDKFTNRLNEEYNAIQVGGPEEVPVGEAPRGRGKVESGVPPTKPPKAPKKGEAEGRKEERRFTERMIKSPGLLAAVKKGIAPTLEYVRQTNAMTVDEAQQILNVLGEDKAYNAMKDPQTKGAVRVVLGQVLIKRYNQLAKEATTQEDKDLYIGATVDIAEYVTVSLATEAGQTIQAFSLWDKLTPEAQLVAASRQKKKSAKKNVEKVRKDVDSIGEKFDKANEEAVKEILKTEEVSNTVKKDSQEGVQKAKDKAAKARKKRADIINKYKGKGGITLSTGGLTKEGIEFVGEVALTYIEEGIAEVQVIVEKVLTDIKNISGKEPNETVKREVLEITDKTLAKSDIDMVKSVKDKKMKIDEVAIQHFTSKERVKKNLAQKFMDQADMSESNAEALAKRFEEAFDRVVSRKKAEILAKNKKRFERIRKAINDQAAVKAEPKTLQDEIIKYSNLGAFDTEDMLQYLAEKFKLGQLTKEQAAKIKELAEKIQTAPEGSPKREATEDLLAYQANLNGGNWGEVAQGIWYANILSGYRTHEKNVVSTFINSWVDIGAEIIADPKSAPYIIAGYINGVRQRGLLEAGRTLVTGRSPIHIQKVETPEALERVRFVGGGYNPANWFKYVGRAMKAEDVLSFQGLKEARAYQLARREASKLGFNTWSGSGWKKVNELLFNTAERYEIAAAQAESEGLKPNTKNYKRRIYELMENSRPTQMTEDAYNFAAHGTYNYQSDGVLGAFTNAISGALDVKIGTVQPVRFVVPFTRILTNVINNALDYSPVGIIRAAKGARGFKSFDDFSLTKGAYKPLTPEQRRIVAIKAAIGISFAAIIQYMAETGMVEVSGGGPEDEKKKAQLRESGWQPYSIKIGDKWYSYELTPLVLTLGTIGNFNDATKYGKEDEQTLLRRMNVAALKFGGIIADMTWINSAATFLGALVEPRVSDQQREVEKALGGMARGFVPFSQITSQTTQAYNKIFQVPAKQVNNSWEAFYQDIPIARNSLNDKINALGEPVIKDIDIMVSREKADPVWKFLTEKQGWVAPLSKKTVFIFDEKLKQDRPLTGDEFYNLSKRRGELIKEDIQKIMKEGYPIIRNGVVENVLGEDMTPKELNNILSKRVEPLATKRAKAEIFGIEYAEKEDSEAKKELTELEKEWWGLNEE